MLVVLFAVSAVLTTPALLLAHARLLKSSPAANSIVSPAPTVLQFWFSERPELRFSKIDLLDSAGAAVPLGSLSSIDSTGIVAPITAPITPGRYSIAWRTAAADGHATSGRFSFVVAAAPAVSAPATPDTTSARHAPARDANAVLESGGASGFSLPVRWAELVAALVLIGAAVFRLFVLPAADWPAEQVNDAGDRARRLAMAVVVLFLVASATRLVAESDLIPSAATARGAAVMATMFDTRWGHGWLFAATGGVISLIGLLFARVTRTGWIITGLGVIAICVGEAMTGHSGAMGRHAPLAVAADVAHFLSGGGWLGGLTCVVLCGLPALRSLDDNGRAAAGTRLANAYHRTAFDCVLLTIATALIAAWLRLNAFSDLWTTPYGTALFRKIVFVLIVLGFGAYHWRTVVTREWTATTAARFRLSATAELIVGAIVVALTTILISTALPTRP
jgi:putative copper export protein/methionine-rich copper-binding protein CopC